MGMTGKLASLCQSLTLWAGICLGRLRPQELAAATPEARSWERYRRVILSALSSAGARAVSVGTMLVTIPLTLNYLGPERFGLWITITSLVNVMGFADLGLGLGIMNAVAEAYGRGDRVKAAAAVSSGFFLLLGLSLVFIAGLALFFPLIPWPRLFKVHTPQALQEAGPAFALYLVCFALNLPLGVVQRVQWGYQEGYYSNFWESMGKILGLLGLLGVIFLQGGLLWLVLALTGAPLLAALLNGLVVFGWQKPWLCPRWQYFELTITRFLLNSGLYFFAFRLSLLLLYGLDNIIIAQFLGIERVSDYAVPYQMFNLALVLYNLIIVPLWPAYSEAIARGDIVWVKNTYHRLFLFILFGIGTCSFILVLFGNDLLSLWVGSQISMSKGLAAGLGLWMVVLTLGNSMTTLLNAANIFRFQIIFIGLCSFLAIFFKCLFIKHFGLPGLIWGTILAYFVSIIVPYSYYIRSKFLKTQPAHV